MRAHDWALQYAERGCPVFPIVGCARRDGSPICRCTRGDECESPGKHPHRFAPHGFRDATTDRATIDDWWRRDPNAAVGIATGHACDVLDVDHSDYRHGVAQLPTLRVPRSTPVVRTGSGKWHLYFAPTGIGRRIRFDGAHCDWLGRGGYVIAPPSPHIAGERYSWHRAWGRELPAVPVALLETLERRTAPATSTTERLDDSSRRWTSSGLLERMAAAREGERNAVLFWCASRVLDDEHAGRVSTSTARAALDELHDTAISVGLGDREIERTIRSACAS